MDEIVADKQTLEGAVEALTGWDEIAIEQCFGTDISGLQEKPTRMMRAMAFVQERHRGTADKEAYNTVMGETTAQVLARFEAVDYDLGEDAPPSA